MTKTSSKTVAVYGALRSGTTLLRLMLDAHPNLSCPGETDFIFDHLREGTRYDEEALERDRIYRAHREFYANWPLATLTPDALINRISGESKTPILMLHRHISKALTLYPDLRIIHFLRDPRDVARSSIGMGWAGNVYYGINHWIETERDWVKIAHQLKPGQALTIHYEKLIEAPEKTLRHICKFVGVQFDKAMLEYDQASTYSKPSKELTFQWRHKQNPHEIGLIEAKIGTMLTEAGYDPSGFVPHHPSGFEKATLMLDNKRVTWSKRIRRFGLIDPILVSIANRLHLPQLSAKALRRIDEKTTNSLK